MDFLEKSHSFTFSRGGLDSNNWKNFILYHFLQMDTWGWKRIFHKFLERTCQSANFLREIIKNSWLGVSLSQLQRELLCSYQTEMTFILQYFHLQRTEKHLIPFETLFGPSLHFSDSSSAPTSFFFAPSPRTRVEILNLRFTLTCTNLHVLHCGVSQDQALVPKWGLIITHSIASAKEQNAKSSDKKFV